MEHDLARALAVLGDLVVPRDLDPEGRSRQSEEAKRSYIGVPFRDFDPARALTVLVYADELIPYEVARLCPAVLGVAARHPEDELLREKLEYLSWALPDDGTNDRAFKAGLDAALEGLDERVEAMDRVLSGVIRQSVLTDVDGSVTLVLARIKRLLLTPPGDEELECLGDR